ncbi:hypothetical protein AOG28_16725 [Cobetia sp. UCD-24C]|nr:hypothetical protein AOG28_16725 [Cobetia sp. UCD-24C]
MLNTYLDDRHVDKYALAYMSIILLQSRDISAEYPVAGCLASLSLLLLLLLLLLLSPLCFTFGRDKAPTEMA